MAEVDRKPTKQERRDVRQRAARRRRATKRLWRAGIIGAVLLIPVLWTLERSGPQELVRAEVIETRMWRRAAGDGTSHTHGAATLLIEGLTETTLGRADAYERGQRVAVWVRRGRITGWPYFLDLAKPGEIERETAAAEKPAEIP